MDRVFLDLSVHSFIPFAKPLLCGSLRQALRETLGDRLEIIHRGSAFDKGSAVLS